MALYKKNQEVVEAVQWDGSQESAEDICNLLGVVGFLFVDDSDAIRITGTNEEVIEAESGDWIIKGVDGDLSCKPDVFTATYKPAD